MSPDGTNFSIGSVEGRVAISPVSAAPASASHKSSFEYFTFKCHRKTLQNAAQIVYPVNSLCYHYHNQNNTSLLFSGGSDGIINVWDWARKKRIYQFASVNNNDNTNSSGTTMPVSIAAMDVNSSGTQLAMAASYMYEQGEIRCVSIYYYYRSIDMYMEE